MISCMSVELRIVYLLKCSISTRELVPSSANTNKFDFDKVANECYVIT